MKDTLALYDELIAGGCTESQARVQATQLGGILSFLAKQDKEINDSLKDLKKDMLWMRLIGGAMTVAFLGNIIFVKCMG